MPQRIAPLLRLAQTRSEVQSAPPHASCGGACLMMSGSCRTALVRLEGEWYSSEPGIRVLEGRTGGPLGSVLEQGGASRACARAHARGSRIEYRGSDPRYSIRRERGGGSRAGSGQLPAPHHCDRPPQGEAPEGRAGDRNGEGQEDVRSAWGDWWLWGWFRRSFRAEWWLAAWVGDDGRILIEHPFVCVPSWAGPLHCLIFSGHVLF